MTTSPGSAAPLRTRSTPTPSTASTPRLGRLSRSGSNAARMRPARMPSSRSSRALAAKRSVSWLSRPSVLTTIAPSKDSWAISLSSARSAWMRVKIGEDSRWKTTLTTITSGKTSRPDERHREVGEQHLGDRDDHHRQRADRHRQRRDRRPCGLDVGVGVGEQLAGRVALVPRHREREVLPGDLAPVGACIRYCMIAGAEPPRHDADGPQDGDAEEQRQDRDQTAGGRGPGLERGQQHVVGRPAEHPGVRHGQGTEEDAAERGEREHPRLAPDRDPEYAKTRQQGGVGLGALAHRLSPSGVLVTTGSTLGGASDIPHVDLPPVPPFASRIAPWRRCTARSGPRCATRLSRRASTHRRCAGGGPSRTS